MSTTQFNSELTNEINVSPEAIEQLIALTADEQDVNGVYVDAVALSYLEGVEIDFQTQGANRSFVFKNVFANSGGSGTCGSCGAAGGGCG
jgi:iron-sulfur cluster insertion protein